MRTRVSGSNPYPRNGRGRRHSVFKDVDISRVAEDVGISPSHLSNIMAGRQSMSLEVAIRLAQVWSRVVGRKVMVEDLDNEFRRVYER